MRKSLVLLIGALILLSACSGQQVTIKSTTVDGEVIEKITQPTSTNTAQPSCVDSDAINGNGRQPTWPGKVTTPEGTFGDKCKDIDTIIEMRCAPNGVKAETVTACGTNKKCLGVGDSFACIPLTCRDRQQGMDEEGVDCGAVCGRKCAAA